MEALEIIKFSPSHKSELVKALIDYPFKIRKFRSYPPWSQENFNNSFDNEESCSVLSQESLVNGVNDREKITLVFHSPKQIKSEIQKNIFVEESENTLEENAILEIKNEGKNKICEKKENEPEFSQLTLKHEEIDLICLKVLKYGWKHVNFSNEDEILKIKKEIFSIIRNFNENNNDTHYFGKEFNSVESEVLENFLEDNEEAKKYTNDLDKSIFEENDSEKNISEVIRCINFAGKAIKINDFKTSLECENSEKSENFIGEFENSMTFEESTNLGKKINQFINSEDFERKEREINDLTNSLKYECPEKSGNLKSSRPFENTTDSDKNINKKSIKSEEREINENFMECEVIEKLNNFPKESEKSMAFEESDDNSEKNINESIKSLSLEEKKKEYNKLIDNSVECLKDDSEKALDVIESEKDFKHEGEVKKISPKEIKKCLEFVINEDLNNNNLKDDEKIIKNKEKINFEISLNELEMQAEKKKEVENKIYDEELKKLEILNKNGVEGINKNIEYKKLNLNLSIQDIDVLEINEYEKDILEKDKKECDKFELNTSPENDLLFWKDLITDALEDINEPTKNEKITTVTNGSQTEWSGSCLCSLAVINQYSSTPTLKSLCLEIGPYTRTPSIKRKCECLVKSRKKERLFLEEEIITLDKEPEEKEEEISKGWFQWSTKIPRTRRVGLSKKARPRPLHSNRKY